MNRDSASSPSTSAARATGASAPASIAARRKRAAAIPDARATASSSTPSSAPCRSSPKIRRIRKSCSSRVARTNRSRRIWLRAAAEPGPPAAPTRSNAASTWARSKDGEAAGSPPRAAATADAPTPRRPCRGDPLRNPIATSISSGSSRVRSDARRSIFSRRPLVSATDRETSTSSPRRMTYNSIDFLRLMSKDSVGRILLLAVTYAAIAWSILVFVTGGFTWDFSHVRISSRDPFRPLLAGVACGIAYRHIASETADEFLRRLVEAIRRRASAIAIVVATITALAGLTRATYSVSGADQYGYITQADLWLSG